MPQKDNIKLVNRKSVHAALGKTGPVLACIDLGTNSFHMIVCQATPERDHFEVMFRTKEAVPFFRRALTNHYLDDAAIRSALRIVKEMAQHAKERDASTILAVATSAVRESKNGEEFLNHIRNELNIDAHMLSGTEEARLIYLGAIWSMPDLDNNFAIIDIGGGSTEIIVGDKTRPSFLQSYKLGAARLTQRFFGKDGPNREKIKQVHEEIAGVLQPAAVKIEACGGYKKLIGTSGTIQAIAKIDRELTGFPKADLQGWQLPLERLKQIISYLEDCAIRGETIKFISNDRSQTILAGAIVLLEAMKALSADEITVCLSALREGVAVDRFIQTGWLTTPSLFPHQDPRSTSVTHLLEKYQGDIKHAKQVANLALEIFRQTRKLLHNYSDEVADLLWAAAMLHDLGMFIGRSGHHKHSYYLIRQEELWGYSKEEVQIIATIARYHRGSTPKDIHESYFSLPQPERKLVTDMAAILRLAEALDRSHRQNVSAVKIKDKSSHNSKTHRHRNKKADNSKSTSLIIEAILAPGHDGKAESWAFQEKKSLFENQFKRQLSLKLNSAI